MIHFLVIAGQSNAAGHGMGPATLPASLDAFDFGQTYIWGGPYGAPYWGVYDPGVNSGSADDPGGWGPEAELLRQMRVNHPGDTILVVKMAFGSTGLAADPGAADWSPSSNGELFDFTTDTIERARRAFTRATGEEAPRPDTVFWMQGEQDATDPARAAAYHDNELGFMAAVRAEWMHDPAGKVIAPRIGDSPAMAHAAAVRVGQWQADQEDANLASFKTIGFTMQADGLHYGAAGHVAIGAAAYGIWEEWF